MTTTANSPTQFFFDLTPERVLEAVESLGVLTTGRVLALNSMENRVYEVELDERSVPTVTSRWDAFRVIKFYRPGRWTREQILEEHNFLVACVEGDISVVAPLVLNSGSTLGEVPGLPIWYAVFPKVGGRILDEMDDAQLRQIGRLIARLHVVGSSAKYKARPTLSVTRLGRESLSFLLEKNFLTPSVAPHYATVAERIMSICEPWFSTVPTQRIHGDFHVGNVLWGSQGPIVVDFDDSCVGPCVQDLWLLVPGRDDDAKRRRDQLLEGYLQMREFDRSSLRLVEPLRALRMIHFSAWIARRIDDPAFKRVFIDFGSERYWREQLIALQEVEEILTNGGHATDY